MKRGAMRAAKQAAAKAALRANCWTCGELIPVADDFCSHACKRKHQQSAAGVREAWLDKTKALRSRGGHVEACALDVVQLAVNGRTADAEKELQAIEAMLRANMPRRRA